MSVTLTKIAELFARPDDFRLSERIPTTANTQSPPYAFNKPTFYAHSSCSDKHFKVIFVHLNTTGQNPFGDKIIELGLVIATWCFRSKMLVSIENFTSYYEDPNMPIPAGVVRSSGIIDKNVNGQRIDDAFVLENVEGHNTLIVARKASVVRSFFERRFPELKSLPWACAIEGVSWKNLGFDSLELKHMLHKLGWFYTDRHRAETECLALGWLFHVVPKSFEMLIEKAQEKSCAIRMKNLPLQIVHQLRNRGYCFQPNNSNHPGYLFGHIYAPDRDKEMKFLSGLPGCSFAEEDVVLIGAMKRFKTDGSQFDTA